MTPFGPRGPGTQPQRHVFGAAFYTHVEAIVRPNADLPIARRPPPFYGAISTAQQDGASAATASTIDELPDPIYMRNLRPISLPPIFHTRAADIPHLNDPRRKRQLERELAEFENQWITGNVDIRPTTSECQLTASRATARADHGGRSANNELAAMRFSSDCNTTADANDPHIARGSGIAHQTTERDKRRREEMIPNIDLRVLESCVKDLRSHVNKEIVECEGESCTKENIQENTAEVEPEKCPTPIAAVEASKESEKLPTPIAAIEACNKSEKLPTPITAIEDCNKSEHLPNPIAAIEACNKSEKLPTPIAAIEACNKSEKLPTPIAAIESCNKLEKLPTPIEAIESCNKLEKLPTPIEAIESCNKLEKLPTPIAAVKASEESEKLPTPIADIEACNESKKLPTPIATIEANDKSEKLATPIPAIEADNKLKELPTPTAAIEAGNKSEKLPTPIAAIQACDKSEKLPTPIAAIEAGSKSEKLPTPIAAIEAGNKSEKLPTPIADPAESKPDVSSSLEATIPELLAESVGNRIPAFIAKKPRTSIALHLKRPRIIEDVTCIEGMIFNRSAFSNISNRLMEPSPAKKSKYEEVIIEEKEEDDISNRFMEPSPAEKSKCEEVIIEEKEEKDDISNRFVEPSPAKKSKCEEVIIEEKEVNISNCFTEPSPAKKAKSDLVIIEEKEEDDEEEEELVSIMANAVEGKRENTNIEATKRCRLRKKFRQLFGKTVTLSEIEEEDELMNESIPKKRRKESRMSLDSGVSLSEVISERATASPDEFHEKIIEKIEELPAEQDKINNIELGEKSCDFNPLVRSMPLLDSVSQEKNNDVTPEALTDISANLAGKPEINLESFGGKFKILITPFDTNGADTFAPMSLEFDLTSGSHVATTTCTTQFVGQENSTSPKKQEESYDLSTLLEISPTKNCLTNQQENTISILGENGTQVTTNILVSTENNVELKSAILADSFSSTSQTKCHLETIREDDSTLKYKDFNQKTISSTTEMCFNDKIGYSDNTDQKSILSIKDTIVGSKNLHQKSLSSDTETFKNKVVDSEVGRKSISSATETLTKVTESEDSNQRKIFSTTETLNPKNWDQRISVPINEKCSTEITSNPTNLNEKTTSSSTERCNNEITINPTKTIQETISFAAEKCIKDVELNSTSMKSKPKDSDQRSIISAADYINGQSPLQSVNSAPQIENIVIKGEVPEVVIKNELPEIATDQEQLINAENTPEVQEQLINIENASEVQGLQINVEKTSTNTEANQNSSNSMPKLRLLHHSELGSRWCPTPMNGSVSSTSENNSAQIAPPTTIQPRLQPANSAELFYPDNQLQYLPFLLGNVVPVIMNNTANLGNNSAQNSYNTSEKHPIYPTPGNFIPQREKTVNNVLTANNNLPSNTTSNIPNSNSYVNIAPNSYNNQGKQLMYVPCDYSLGNGTTMSKETPSNVNGNFSSTLTSNTQILYNNTAQNNYNSPGNQSAHVSTGYSVPNATTSNQKKDPTPAHTNCSSSTMTKNLYSKEASIGHNVLQKSSAVPIDYSVAQETTNNQKTPSSANIFPTSPIPANIQSLLRIEAQNGHNIPQKEQTQLLHGHSVAQGITNNQKTASTASTNFPSSNTQTTQIGANISQQQQKNLAQGTTSSQTSYLQNSSIRYTFDSVFSKVHEYMLVLQNCIRLSYLAPPVHQRAQLRKNFVDNKTLFFAELLKYCMLLNTNNINIAVEDFVQRYEQLVEPDQRKFDLKEVLYILRLETLSVLNHGPQMPHCPPAASAANSASRRPYAKKNSTSRVAENKKRRCAAAQPGSTMNSAAPQPGTSNSRTPPTYVTIAPQPGTSNSRTPPTYVTIAPQPGTSNSRTPPTYVTKVPQPGTSNSRTPPTYVTKVPQPGTSNSRTPPTYVTVVPQPGTSNSQTPPAFVSGIPQPGTGNSQTPPGFASGVPQPGTENSRTPPTYVTVVPQTGTGNSQTAPVFASGVPQPGTGNSRTPPTYVTGVPQPGTGNSRTPPTYVTGVPQPGTGNSRTPPTYVTGVPQPVTGNSRTPPTYVTGVPQPVTGNSRTPPTYVTRVPQPGTGNSRTPPTIAPGVPQIGTGNSRTPPTFASGVPQPGTENSRTPPTFASGFPQPGTTKSRPSPAYVTGVPQPGTTKSRTPPTFVSGVPQPGTGNSRTPPTIASGVPQIGTGNSRTPPTFASVVPQPGTGNLRPSPTYASVVPQPGTGNSRIPPAFSSGVPQNGTPPMFAYAVPQPQFPRPRPPPAAVPLRGLHDFPGIETPGKFVYPPAAQQLLSRQIECCNIFFKRLYIDLCAIAMKDPTYQYIESYQEAYRHALANSIREEELRRRQLHELRQRSAMNTLAQQEIISSQRRINPNSTFVPPTINNSRLAQPNSTRGPIFSGVLENIRNLVENVDTNRRIAIQNPASCCNQARTSLPVDHVNARQESHQSSQNSVVNMKNHMDNVIEATLRNCLTADNNNPQLQLQKNTAATVPQNPLNNPLDIAVPVENNVPDLQIRPVVPFQPNTPQEAINNRKAQLEMRLNSATNQQNEPEEFPGSRNRRTAILTDKKQRQNPGTSGQESACEEPTNCDNLNGIEGTNEENAVIRKSNRKNRKNETPATNDEETVEEPEEINNNAQWEVKTSPLKTSDQQRSQELKVRLKRVNIPANHHSDNQIELRQSSAAVAEPVSVSVGNSGPQLELQTNFAAEVQPIVAQEAVCGNSGNVNVSVDKNQSEQRQSPDINQKNVRDDSAIILPCNNSTTDENLAVNLTVERSELPQSSAELNVESIQENSSVSPCNDSTETDENVGVNLIKERAELRQNPVENQEAIRTNNSSSLFNDSTPIAKQTTKDVAEVLTAQGTELRQSSAIDDETLSSNAKNVKKLSSNGCNVRVVDVLEELDALSSKNKDKISASTVAQSLASPEKKSLPLVTTIVPIDLIEEKTENLESEEEDNDFTLYQSEDESAVSPGQISVITINDDDDDDDFNLQWIEEPNTVETVNEEVTLPQRAEIPAEDNSEIREITSPESAEKAETEENEIREVTSPENAETAEREENEIREVTSANNAETAEEEAIEIEVTSPEIAEIVVVVEEETVDKTSCEIAEEPEEIQDEPMEIFSILDVKSISKDAYNNMGDNGDIEPEISSETIQSSIEESTEADNLGINDVLQPNCSRCGKSSSVVCEQCYAAFYCSAECHFTHWTEIHHLSCQPVPEEARQLMP